MSEKKPEVTKQTEAQAHDAELIKATVKAVTEEMIPTMLAVMGTRGSSVDSSNPEAMSTIKVATEQELQYRKSSVCQECGQRTAGCKGEHSFITVFPTKFPQYAEYFQGVFINGVRYLSNNAEHKIPVPKNAAGDILFKIQKAEDEEMIGRTGRVKHNNSGDVSSPRPFNPAKDGFR